MRKLFGGLALFLCVTVASLAATPGGVRPWFATDTVDVTPALDTLILNTNTTLTARTVDAAGLTTNPNLTWIIRDTSGVRPFIPGRIRGKQAIVWAKGDTGRSYVVAIDSVTGKKDSSLIIVIDTICSTTTLGSLALFPESTVVRRTDTVGVFAFPRDQCGNYLAGQNVVWSSGDSADAIIIRKDSLHGLIVALDSANGPEYIKGVIGSKRDSVKVKTKAAP